MIATTPPVKKCWSKLLIWAQTAKFFKKLLKILEVEIQLSTKEKWRKESDKGKIENLFMRRKWRIQKKPKKKRLWSKFEQNSGGYRTWTANKKAKESWKENRPSLLEWGIQYSLLVMFLMKTVLRKKIARTSNILHRHKHEIKRIVWRISYFFLWPYG